MSGHKEPLYNIAKCKLIAKAWHTQHYAAIESDATGRKAREGVYTVGTFCGRGRGCKLGKSRSSTYYVRTPTV